MPWTAGNKHHLDSNSFGGKGRANTCYFGELTSPVASLLCCTSADSSKVEVPHEKKG